MHELTLGWLLGKHSETALGSVVLRTGSNGGGGTSLCGGTRAPEHRANPGARRSFRGEGLVGAGGKRLRGGARSEGRREGVCHLSLQIPVSSWLIRLGNPSWGQTLGR